MTSPTPVPKTERTNLPFDDVAAWQLRRRSWQHTTGLPGAGRLVAAVRRKAGFPYKHFGIYLGDGSVIHFAGEPGAYRERKAGIQRTAVAGFARGSKRLWLEPEEGGVVFSPGITIARALTRVGTGDYDLLTNNCEHFVWWCLTGEPHSDQVRPRRVAKSSLDSSVYSYREIRGRRVPERTTQQIRVATARPFSFDHSWRRGPPRSAPIWLGWIGRAGNSGWSTAIPLLRKPAPTLLTGWGLPWAREYEWHTLPGARPAWRELPSRRVGIPETVGSLWISGCGDDRLYVCLGEDVWRCGPAARMSVKWLAARANPWLR